MENLTEQVVRREKGARYYVNLLLIILATFGIPTTLVVLGFLIPRPYLIYVAIFVFMFCVYGAWYFITSMKVEYEYAVLSNILRIDKVIAKRRRRAMLKFDIKSVSDIYRYSDEEMSSRKYAKVYFASAREYGDENYVISFNSEARGKCALVFTPNEEVLTAMKPYFNNELKKKLFLSEKR